ncbi:hypothetical protein A7D00_5838 [Trichophyton violaceum]|uniref:Uncharacterized protein n=1 Tax=Trichophyton violaceum TaxID=34388 RepID=A0A178FBU2_TRIVO|nr:hypothetical protein A7D00_5838 [Trichophyton violaceum]
MDKIVCKSTVLTLPWNLVAWLIHLTPAALNKAGAGLLLNSKYQELPKRLHTAWIQLPALLIGPQVGLVRQQQRLARKPIELGVHDGIAKSHQPWRIFECARSRKPMSPITGRWRCPRTIVGVYPEGNHGSPEHWKEGFAQSETVLTVIMLGQLEMGEGGCIDIYCRVFNKVFNEKKHFTLMNISGKIQARFDSDKLEKIIKEIISRKGIPEN